MLLDLISSLASGTGDPAILITEILLVFAIVLFSLSAHEAAHAYAAKKLGDYTAYYQGRVTLNPLKHLNPFGALSMLLVGIGWANPVPINPANFKNPRKGMMLSSLAGPLSNLCIAVISTFCGSLSNFIYKLVAANGGMTEGLYYVFYALVIFFYYAAYLNFSLAVFNLIPCPPFDGSRIFFYFLPKSWYFKVMRYERYLGLAVLILILVLSRFGIYPVAFIADGLHTLISGPFDKFFDLILNLIR